MSETGQQAARRSVILIGMPGAGKSTVGVILAKELGLDFIDADLVIQAREQKLLREIIEERGVDGFLLAESEACLSIDPPRGAVIATGGSAVYGEVAMRHLKEIGRVVYLAISAEELALRLRDLKMRGVVLREGQTLGDLCRERTPLYERWADVTVCEDGLGIEETLTKVREALGR